MTRISNRPKNNRKIPPDLILIVTEGEKTEPLYFEKFPIHTTKVVKKSNWYRNKYIIIDKGN